MTPAAVAILLTALTANAPADKAEAPVLRVYLPRTVSVGGDALRLGQITVIRCDDEALAVKASALRMGRGPWPAERIVFGRKLLLSLLAGEGIGPSRVRTSGAASVTVVGRGQLVRAADILARAEGLLTESGVMPPGQRWRVANKPQDLVLAETGKVKLTARLAERSPADHVQVMVQAAVGTAKATEVKVLFRRVYAATRAVATREIAPGASVGPENVRVETVMTETRPDPNWSSPHGAIATRRIAPGAVVHPGSVRRKRTPPVVRRNQNVIMRISGPGFSISGTGQALQDGKPGEHIRVRNIDSKRIITARVMSDGTVEPSFEETRR